MKTFRRCFLFFFCTAAGACAPKLLPYAPPQSPLVIYADEPALNAALGDAEPFLARRLAEAHPQFASPRVRIILLETLVELGSYNEACTLGEALLSLPDRPPKKPKYQKKAVKRAKNSKKIEKTPIKKTDFPQYLTESQRHKVYFNLALAYEGLGDAVKAQEYFEQTAKRPNYYYLYRYAQNRMGAGDGDRALLLLKESYERSHGKFTYVNESYAGLLVRRAFGVYAKNPREARAKLALVLGDEHLKKCAAAARAEILWHQWF